MACSKPYALSDTFEQVLMSHCGFEKEPFPDKDIERLARGVKKIADAYTEERKPGALFSNPELRLAYSAYYLPCNAIKLFPILSELERKSVLPRQESTLRVLDLGCGPGTLFAGLLDYLLQHRAHSSLRMDLTGIDRDPGNCSAARSLIKDLAKTPGMPEVRSMRFLTGEMHELDRLTAGDTFDLILAGNLVNELRANMLADFADRISSLLQPSAVLIILDPGTRNSFKNLLMFRQEMLTRPGMHLAAPCLHSSMCPLQDRADAWCHEKLFWTPPPIVSLIDRRTGFTKQKGVKFSYLAMTRGTASPQTRKTSTPPAEMWRVTSYVIRNKGEERLYVCNGLERLLLRRLTRIANPESADFSSCERGDIVTIQGAEPRAGFMNIGPETVFRKTV